MLKKTLGLVLLFALAIAPSFAFAQEKKSGSKLEKDILYRSEEGLDDYAKKQCRLDVHYPSEKGFATVVWFHGGGLTGGDKAIPAYLKDQGYAVVSANYRHHPHVNAPVYIEDAAAAVAWTFANIESYGGDPNKIFVSGHSAGGYLTSMVTLDKRWLAAHQIDADQIAGAIPHSGHTITHFTVRKERGIDSLKVVVDDLAPLNHVRKDAPPILLTTGDREMEMIGRYEENAYLWRMFQEAGHPDCTLRELEGFDHGNMVQPAALLMKPFVKKHASGK
ncbi:alpha/beta hydrolase [Bremerella cremea]|uniref:Alpha/beta hydrolase n=1 Tax=Bremerella cremea TaxID=1031537 RepID=A0A368KK40_9BACT|nr:alpha/beta hydrolase [Bremerella cremea]RCS41054.1 alpha/beta hydrolase [Bremerella cremea]